MIFRRLAAVAVALLLTAAPAATAHASNPFVTRSGTHLVLDGRPFLFTGINVYNANSRDNCWYTLGTGGGLASSLTRLRGGHAVIRAWFFQNEATTAGHRDWSAFDHTLAAARAAGVRVIPVLVNQWGQCEGWSSYTAGYKSESWYRSGYRRLPTSPGMSATYRGWVRQVVTRYRNNPTILAWQMVNEAEDKTSYSGDCSSTAPATLRSFAADISTLIKRIDPHHLVSIGTIGSGQCGSAGSAYQSLHALPHVDLCEIHDYSGAVMPGDRWNGLRVRLDQCAADHKVAFVGESGIRTGASMTPAQRAILFRRKLVAQRRAGVSGMLVWDWRDAAHGGTATSGYEIGPGDPVLRILAAYRH